MVRSSAAVSNTSGAALQNKKTGKATKASSNSMKTRQSPVLPASHTPRNIRLVPTPSAGQKPRQRPAVVLPFILDDAVPSSSPSMALSPFVPHPLVLWEGPGIATFYMDFGGHCHEALEDGGYLFMDQFGHCHARLDDGGFLYMDRQGSAHRALDEDAPQGAPQRSPRVGHVANASAMLGAAETPAASKDATMAHDREMRAMRRKATKSAVHGGNKGKTHSFKKANVATRQRHFIGQPRKFN